jgi:hypothetical protein
MVLMSAGKNARHQASIVVRTNVCGGPKKAGTAPRIGFYLSSMKGHLYGAPQSIPKFCMVSKTVQTQKYGYHAVHGGNMG